jgi:hypothetical protein
MGNVRSFILVALVTGSVIGCATPISPETEAAAQKPLTCTTESQCSLYWQRAQFWLARNSTTKLQTATDTVLQTYTPHNSTELVYEITRERHADGTSRIWVGSLCRNPWVA